MFAAVAESGEKRAPCAGIDIETTASSHRLIGHHADRSPLNAAEPIRCSGEVGVGSLKEGALVQDLLQYLGASYGLWMRWHRESRDGIDSIAGSAVSGLAPVAIR